MVWQFEYPDGTRTTTIFTFNRQTVRLVMTSEDVLHSFFVPAFRVKHDIVPGDIPRFGLRSDQDGHLPVVLHGILRKGPLGYVGEGPRSDDATIRSGGRRR